MRAAAAPAASSEIFRESCHFISRCSHAGLGFIAPRVLNRQWLNVLHPDETEPELDIPGLVVEPGRRSWQVLPVLLASGIDNHRPWGLKEWPEPLAVEGEQHVALRDEVDELLQLVR